MQTVTRSYKSKLYPSKKQAEKLEEINDAMRFIWNLCVAQRMYLSNIPNGTKAPTKLIIGKGDKAKEILIQGMHRTLAELARERIYAFENELALEPIPKNSGLRDKDGKIINLASGLSNTQTQSLQIAELPELYKMMGWEQLFPASCHSLVPIKLADNWKTFYSKIKQDPDAKPPSFKAKNFAPFWIHFRGNKGGALKGLAIYSNYVSISANRQAITGSIQARLSNIPAEALKGNRAGIASISKDGTGQYWLHRTYTGVAYSMPDSTKNIVGVDLGIVYYATISNGEVAHRLSAIQPLKKELEKLRHISKVISRKLNRTLVMQGLKPTSENIKKYYRTFVLESKGLKKQVDKRRALHQKIANYRKQMITLVCADILKDNDIIVLEDLNVFGMGQNTKLARTIKDASWGSFYMQLERMAQEQNKELRFVAPNYTSQACNKCNHIAKENRKTQSLFECVECGHIDNADDNAAHNIRAKGMIEGQYSHTRLNKKKVRSRKAKKENDLTEKG